MMPQKRNPLPGATRRLLPPNLLAAFCTFCAISAFCMLATPAHANTVEEKAEKLRLILLNNNRTSWDTEKDTSQEEERDNPPTPQYVRMQQAASRTSGQTPEKTQGAKPPQQDFQISETRLKQNISSIKRGVSLSQIPKKLVLARVTAYWAEGGDTDAWSARNESSTQTTLICLHHAAVDPTKIPYGSRLLIQYGQGRIAVKAVDTGGDVKNRRAARNMGKTPEEQNALVVDVFFQKKEDAIEYTKTNPPFQWVEVIPPAEKG